MKETQPQGKALHSWNRSRSMETTNWTEEQIQIGYIENENLDQIQPQNEEESPSTLESVAQDVNSNPDDLVLESQTINPIDPDPDELESGFQGLTVSGLNCDIERDFDSKSITDTSLRNGFNGENADPDTNLDRFIETEDEIGGTVELELDPLMDESENPFDHQEIPDDLSRIDPEEELEDEEEELGGLDAELLEDDPDEGMTPEEKQAMYESVKEGDVEKLDDLLDLPRADINMEWFNENLLMAAIRAERVEMAEFLLDNGVNPRFSTTLFEVRNDEEKEVDCYEVNCRQMAYESEMWDLVDLIDHYSGEAWGYGKKKHRQPRLKKPLEEKIRERREEAERQRALAGQSSSRATSRSTSRSTLTDRSTTSHTTQDSPRMSLAESEGQEPHNEENGNDEAQTGNDETQTGSTSDVLSASGTSLMSSTLSLVTSFHDYIDDPNPMDSLKRVTLHKYKPTKSFFSRVLSSDLKIREMESVKGTNSNDNSVAESKEINPLKKENVGQMAKKGWFPSETGEYSTGKRQDIHIPSKKRILCPWIDDDPEKLQIFQKRVKSAPVIFNSPATNQKPKLTLSRTHTTLSILNEFDLEGSPVTASKCHKFKSKSMPDRYMKAYLHHQEHYSKNNSINLEEYTGVSRSFVNSDKGQDQGHSDSRACVFPDLTWPRSLSYYRSSSVSSSSTSILSRSSSVENLKLEQREPKTRSPETRDKGSGASVQRLGTQTRRKSGSKLHSPAGYLDTSEKFNGKKPKLPTLLINSVYKGHNYLDVQ